MLIDLARGLDPARFRPVACLLKEGWLAAQLRAAGVRTYVLPQRPGLDARWPIGLARLVLSEGVDLLHAHEFAMNVAATIVGAALGRPVVATVHGKNYYPDVFRRRLAYRCVGRSAAMVAVSAEIQRFLQERAGVAGSLAAVIRNGVDAGRFTPDSVVRQRVRSELGIHGDRPVLGCFGSHYPVKGQAHLLEAMARVSASRPDARLLLAGRGPLQGELQRRARTLGLENAVRFLGFRDDIPGLLQAIDVFVLPSLSEGLPLALLEAMANGKPIVATRVGGVPEVIADGESGLLVRPGSPDDLAAAVLRLLADRGLAARLGQTARERASRDHTLTAMVRAYQDLYDSQIAARRRSLLARLSRPAAAPARVGADRPPDASERISQTGHST
jgi:glycosyltransferase involved in cell wall biosynthesis